MRVSIGASANAEMSPGLGRYLIRDKEGDGVWLMYGKPKGKVRFLLALRSVIMIHVPAVARTFKSAHVTQVDLGDGELAHVAGQDELATVVQVLLLDARKPCHHLRRDLACVWVGGGGVRVSGWVHEVDGWVGHLGWVGGWVRA